MVKVIYFLFACSNKKWTSPHEDIAEHLLMNGADLDVKDKVSV